MPSQQADALLIRIGALYQEALVATDDDDLQRALSLVADADPLVESLTALGAVGAADNPRYGSVMRAYGDLVDRLASERGDARASVQRGRQGRKLLAAYGRRLTDSGTRLQRNG